MLPASSSCVFGRRFFTRPREFRHVDLEAREEHEQQLAQIREKLDDGPVRMQHAEDLLDRAARPLE
jgi:hypothetical protein